MLFYKAAGQKYNARKMLIDEGGKFLPKLCSWISVRKSSTSAQKTENLMGKIHDQDPRTPGQTGPQVRTPG